MKTPNSLAPVYILNYDHLGVILWKISSLESVLATEIERLSAHPGFKIGWDHEAFTYDHLAENEPELFGRMVEALAQFPERLGVGTCTYGQPLSQFINEESNVRQLTMGLATVESRLGVSPSVYLMSEHAMHSQIPQLLVGCGFKGAILRTHFTMYGYPPTIEAPVVWWVGLDGSHVPAVPTYPGQVSSPAIPARPQTFGSVTLDNRILCDYALYPDDLSAFREQFGDRIRPLVASRADDPRQREEIVTAHEGDSDYVWELADDIFDRLPQPREDFRTASDDFGVRMPWGFCGNWIWNRSREAEVAVLNAERLAALNAVLGGDDYEDSLTSAWKALLVAQHHDIQIVGLEDEARTYLDASLACSSEVTTAVTDRIASRVGVPQEPRWVLFNPLHWERTEWVEETGHAVTVPDLVFARWWGQGSRPRLR